MLYTHELTKESQALFSLDLELRHPHPIHSFIVSWNGLRPSHGLFEILISLDRQLWHPYVCWGAQIQHGYCLQKDLCIQHDIVVMLPEKPFSGFYIRLKGPLKGIRRLNIFIIDSFFNDVPLPLSELDIRLAFKGLSQMQTKDSISSRICSPTATSAVLNYLCPDLKLDPLQFAKECYDHKQDLYGNWVLNVAAASHYLPPSWTAVVAHLQTFEIILSQLKRQIPTIVSIKGPLQEAPLPYAQGHLMVVIGFKNQDVICMDPAHEKDEMTLVSYPLQDFLTAWQRRRNLAYVFFPASEPPSLLPLATSSLGSIAVIS